MPDPNSMARAMGLAFLTTALVLGLCTWWSRRRGTQPALWIDAGWVVGLAAGFSLGCGLLLPWPHWPPREDLDRFLLIIIPAVLIVELVGAFPRLNRLYWVLWGMVIVCALRVLLHGSIYLAGPPARAWSPAQRALILGSLTGALAAAWIHLTRLARRAPGISTVVALAIAVGGSALTIMLSGYATGGQAGLPLSAALLGGAAVAWLRPGPARGDAPIGVGVVGLFSLLVIGRFFGELRTDHALVLFAAPVLAWLPELPRLRRLPAWARGLLRVLLVGLVVGAVLGDAARRFAAESGPTQPGSKEPSIEDYMDPGL
ncbi:MAG TPA: hypothetical protein VFF52_02160 [Isosphaeraceae bacterium]|nr:hypothetical protein [Isosphaeraceae bacterium]